ncbi:FliM/FliN family flagellar motor C-terminal domain-containing protein [Ruegeria marisrubri]|uniref:FliM/FliN family flagellar motor switch protein n=1 Tax=Ruegeria TaxID=97050 RepID=UPI00148802E4|nr:MULTISPECIES: FliM/FliN family flagellar motor C-terminal domain-containing protein [Ruegeria]MCA0907956.1 FliM/FliN family flagellar motor C-terminal domain-containing protein [Ruegeria marisrubri]UUV05798.1 FliM/FliN family flagellar motor C-terminal domain-containing protein [Ruegeria sp. YS9]
MNDTQIPKSEKPNPFDSVPIEVTVSVGRARPLIKDLLNMGENAVLTLDKRIEDPVDLYVGDQLVARGLLEEMDGDQAGQLAVRLTEIADLHNGIG